MRGAAAVVSIAALAACSGQVASKLVLPSPFVISGTVASGSKPIAGANVTLYRAGAERSRTGASALGRSTSGADGRFTIPYKSVASNDVIYVVATGGSVGNGPNSAIGLTGLLGTGASFTSVATLNEFSTVSMAYALAQFTDPTGRVVGAASANAVGIANAVALDTTNLVGTSGGKPARFWPAQASCAHARDGSNCEGLERLNTIANLLAACDQSGGASSHACAALFTATKADGSTLAAVHAIVTNPARNAATLFTLAKANRSYAPPLRSAPDAWTLALKYVGNGHEFDGPGIVAFDAHGNAWVGNNYAYNADQHVPTCGGKELLELAPVGTDAPGAPFSGGGIDGVGFGVTLDLKGNVWAANFGFAGKGCTVTPAANSISEFDGSGAARSPAHGYTQGSISRPQGTVVDPAGNIWIANFGSASVTEYRNASPASAVNIADIGLENPFGVAADASGRIWVTGFGNSSVAVLASRNGHPVSGSPFTAGGIKKPLGIVVDTLGNAWISNSLGNSVSMLNPDGTPHAGSPFSGGGISLPWGITVDGNDNVWVGDFRAKSPRISLLCGARSNCRPGTPLSPATGFTSSLLMRTTGITVDASGNVWVPDNWRQVPFQTNPGGDGLVEFVGIAAPVRMPAAGPPRRP